MQGNSIARKTNYYHKVNNFNIKALIFLDGEMKLRDRPHFQNRLRICIQDSARNFFE